MTISRRVILILSIVVAIPALLWLALPGLAQPTTCNVPSGPYPTIQSAVNDASCDVIALANQSYGENVSIGRSLTIQGMGQGSSIVDGGGTSSVFSISGGSTTVTLTEMTIQNGATSSGGGVVNTADHVLLDTVTIQNSSGTTRGGGVHSNSSSDLTVRNSLILSNTGGEGGGISHQFGTLLIEESIIQGNIATAINGGGGIRNSGTMTMTVSDVLSNTASFGSGGGLSSPGVTNVFSSTINWNLAAGNGGGFEGTFAFGFQMHFSTVNGNIATGNGGGLYFQQGGATSTIDRSTISRNMAAGDGGGIGNNSATLSLVNSTISTNDATGNGGGIYYSNLFGGDTSTTFTTIADNTAVDGKSIYIDSQPPAQEQAGDFTIFSSILSGGGGTANCGGLLQFLVSTGYNIVEDASCGISGQNDQESTDPELDDLLAFPGIDLEGHTPLSGSPAIGTGPNPCNDAGGNPVWVDQPGNSRANPCSRGAVEGVNQPGPTTIIINEIMHQSTGLVQPPIDAGDLQWIELYNPDPGQPVNLNGWTISTTNFLKVINTNLMVQPEGYVVLCRNKTALDTFFSDTACDFEYNVALGTSADNIVIKSATNEEIDRVQYEDGFPWPNVPFGFFTGKSFCLVDPSLDNDLGENWRESLKLIGTTTSGRQRGTPNAANVGCEDVIITEIHYNSRQFETDDGHWIELYNPIPVPVDLQGWCLDTVDLPSSANCFTDPQGHTINESLVIPSKGYVILCVDTVVMASLNINCDYDGLTLNRRDEPTIIVYSDVNSDGTTPVSRVRTGVGSFPIDSPAGIAICLDNLFNDESFHRNWGVSMALQGSSTQDLGTPGVGPNFANCQRDVNTSSHLDYQMAVHADPQLRPNLFEQPAYSGNDVILGFTISYSDAITAPVVNGGDGVTFNDLNWEEGQDGGSVDVVVSGSGCLNGWIDWDNDDSFEESGDRIIVDSLTGSGTYTFDIPVGALSGASVQFNARFRVQADCGEIDLPHGTTFGGEVEDYSIRFGYAVFMPAILSP